MFEEEPDEALELLARMSHATDRALAELARRLAGRLALDLARTGPATGRGVGKLARIPAGPDSGDLDLDASIDGIVTARGEQRPVALDDLVASVWRRPDTAICLLVDRSGSMNGQRLASAALAAAVCAWRAPQQLSVMTFGDRVIELKGITESVPNERLVADVLGLRGHGTTDVDLALRAAGRQLAGVSAGRRVTVLLSDAEVTVGRDPVPAAKALDELVIVAPAEEPQHAAALARASGARVVEVDGPLSVLGALRRAIA